MTTEVVTEDLVVAVVAATMIVVALTEDLAAAEVTMIAVALTEDLVEAAAVVILVAEEATLEVGGEARFSGIFLYHIWFLTFSFPFVYFKVITLTEAATVADVAVEAVMEEGISKYKQLIKMDTWRSLVGVANGAMWAV
jgi:hypothetical protein